VGKWENTFFAKKLDRGLNTFKLFKKQLLQEQNEISENNFSLRRTSFSAWSPITYTCFSGI
jgi:hypothetical protein